jgi:predicted aspartyl protease
MNVASLFRRYSQQVIYAGMALIFSASGVCVDAASSRLETRLPDEEYFAIELHRIPTGHHWLKASLNGKVGYFILDTGAGGTVLDPSALNRFGIEADSAQGVKTSAGAGGAAQFKLYPVESFSIEEHALELSEVAAVDLGAVLPGLSSLAGVNLHGIIGQDVLTAHAGILEVSADHLYLRKTSGKEPEATDASAAWRQSLLGDGFMTLPLEKLSTGHETVGAEINGVEGRFIIDSGARLSVVNGARLAHFDMKPSDRLEQESASGGVGGAISIRIYRLREFRLEEVTIPQVTIGAFDLSAVVSAIEGETGVAVDGVIGQDTLLRHRAIIDIAGQFLLLADVPQEGESR